ncbi:MAG: type II secretion system protein [bacterium]
MILKYHYFKKYYCVLSKSQTQYLKGFTIVEILITISIIFTLSGIAIPSYRNYLYKARIARTVTEIRILEKEIWAYQVDINSQTFELNNEDLPVSLDDIGHGNLRDPWDNHYEYMRLVWSKKGEKEGEEDKKVKGKTDEGKMRKDRFLKPINTDYDLYSMGQDGKSKPNLNAKDSHDDIIRASNGAYVGLASEF